MPEKPPNKLRITCKVKLEDGKPCGGWKLYRVIPENYHPEGKSPEEIGQDIVRFTRERMVDFFSTHLSQKHPVETEAIRDSVNKITNHVLLEYLLKVIETKQEE